MEEVHINSSDLTADIKSAASENSTASLLKVCRRGDKIYYVNDENVTTIKEANNQNKLVDDLTDSQFDQVSSGESLYKTFSFDNAISKEETEKCISFWRGVVEKNLEPIKCTIIESMSDPKQPHNNTWKNNKDKCKKKTKKSDKTHSTDNLIRERRNNIWLDILGELQKRRLKKTKLLVEKRCRLCEYLTSIPYEGEDFQTEFKQHIKELDDWRPKSTKQFLLPGPRRTSVSSSESKKSANEHRLSHRRSTISGKLDSKEIIEKVVEVPSEIKSKKSDTPFLSKQSDDPFLASVKEAANKIEYIDAIEKKIRENIYSKWRKNKVENVCKCSRGSCVCNTNPAVVAVTRSINGLQKDAVNVPAKPDMKAQHTFKDAQKESTKNDLMQKDSQKDAVNVPVKPDMKAQHTFKDAQKESTKNDLVQKDSQKDI